jgi:hypothetical protein
MTDPPEPQRRRHWYERANKPVALHPSVARLRSSVIGVTLFGTLVMAGSVLIHSVAFYTVLSIFVVPIMLRSGKSA